MASQEELDFLKNNLGKIRGMYNADDKKELTPTALEAIKIVSPHIDVIRENFLDFANSGNAIFYPDEFIYSMKNIEGGKQILFDNIDFILRKYSHKRTNMTLALEELDGIEKLCLEDFSNKFNLFVKGKPEPEEDIFNEEYFNPKYELTGEGESFRACIFLRIIARCENPAEVLEANKSLFLSPRFASSMPKFIEILAQNKNCHEFLRANFDRIKKCVKEDYLVKIYKEIKDIYPEEYDKNRFIIEQMYIPAMELLENNVDYSDYDIHKMKIDQVLRTCSTIIAQDKSKEIEILANFISSSDANSQIEIAGMGAYSTVIKTGGKVLKIGTERNDNPFEIPYHPRILKPIIRKKDVSKNPEHPLYIEVQDEVDVETEITDEELLEVYIELRKAGIKWCDASKYNLGRPKADNYGYPIGGYGPPSNNQSLGLIGKDSLEDVKKQGKPVIIDLDYIYPANCKNAGFTRRVPDFIRRFEAEFEKQEKNEKEHEFNP